MVMVVPVFEVLASEHLDGVWQYGCEGLHALGDGLGVARQVDDQAAPADAGDATRDHGQGSLAEAIEAKDLGDARNLILYHFAHGLWRAVARRQSCAASRDDEVDALIVGQVDEQLRDLCRLIGHDSAIDHLRAHGLQCIR